MVDTEKYAETFALLDADGDGLVSASELKELMGGLGQEFDDDAVARAVEIMDTDGDGLVSLEELAGYLGSPEAPQPRDG
jgi:Ca2+-binding EF-hand superfamily protein